MTTAHRATWRSAVGLGSRQGNFSLGGVASTSFAKRDASGQTVLKVRRGGAVGQDRKDVLRKLEEREREAGGSAIDNGDSGNVVVAKLEDNAVELKLDGIEDFDDEDADISSAEEGEQRHEQAKRRKRRRKRKLEAEIPATKNLVGIDVGSSSSSDDGDDDDDADADEKGDNNHPLGRAEAEYGSDASDSDFDEDDDNDDESFLLQELERIKEERRQEDERRAAEDAEIAGKAARAAVDAQQRHVGGGIKRRWNDDAIFRIKTKAGSGAEKQQSKATFVNDTVQNDFHRKFLKKYIK
eukprot:g4739.t1